MSPSRDMTIAPDIRPNYPSTVGDRMVGLAETPNLVFELAFDDMNG